MACKSWNIVFKPGDDIKWAGAITQANIIDFTGYSVAAQFYAKNMSTGKPGTLLGTASVSWINQVAGTFHLEVDRAVTAEWPEDITIMTDIKVTHPDDTRVRTETFEFTTTTGVTESV